MTPEPSESCDSGGTLIRSPKKRWNTGSSTSGLRRLIWRVAAMLTTEGVAFLAASLKVRRGDAVTAVIEAAGAASRTSTTCVRHDSQSGFTTLTTKIAARVRVTAWEKRIQSLRIAPIFSQGRRGSA